MMKNNVVRLRRFGGSPLKRLGPLTERQKAYLRVRVKQESYWLVARYGSNADGIAIPYQTIEGDWMEDFLRTRLDVMRKKQKFDQPSASRNYLYYAPRIDDLTWLEIANDPERVIQMCEGEFKAGALAQYGHAAIGLGGVSNYRYRPNGKENPSEVMPDFKDIVWKGRSVVINCDADTKTNPYVQAANRGLATLLTESGAEVCFRIPDDLGDGKTGIDDLIAKKGIEAWEKLPAIPAADKSFAHWGSRELGLRRDGKRTILDEENIRRALVNDPTLAELFDYNTFAAELRLLRPVNRPSGKKHKGYPRGWTDSETVLLTQHIQSKGGLPNISKTKVDAVVIAYAQFTASVHPLRAYLRGLKWDKTPRLDSFLTNYFGAHGAPPGYLSAVGRCWMISAVARVLRPGCKADYALVLEGRQGKKKSEAVRLLAGAENFSDSLPEDLGSKDARDHVRGVWIIELPELSQFRKSEIETVKAFLSRRQEKFRPAYARHEITYQRQCVFIGSTNEHVYLQDQSGNRRFWPVRVGEIDLKTLRADRDQLWAEAVYRYDAKERWYLDKATEKLAEQQTAVRTMVDPWDTEIARLLKVHPGLRSRSEVMPSHVLAVMELRTGERSPGAAKRVANGLRRLGWALGRRANKGQFYIRPHKSLKKPSETSIGTKKHSK